MKKTSGRECDEKCGREKTLHSMQIGKTEEVVKTITDRVNVNMWVGKRCTEVDEVDGGLIANVKINIERMQKRAKGVHGKMKKKERVTHLMRKNKKDEGEDEKDDQNSFL